MPDDETDPQTAAMLAGAEIEQGPSDDGVEHHPRTDPPDEPPHPDDSDRAVLTTDPQAQQPESVIQPDKQLTAAEQRSCSPGG